MGTGEGDGGRHPSTGGTGAEGEGTGPTKRKKDYDKRGGEDMQNYIYTQWSSHSQ